MSIKDPIMSTFVDNIKVMEVKESGYIKKVKQKLVTAFEMVNMGLISFNLGLKVEKDCQKKR